MKVGLVLGGGAARGIAHIGVLKVLHNHGIPIDMIAATSVGAMIGAFYCAGISPEEMEVGAKRLGWSRLLRVTIPFRGAFSSKKMDTYVEKIIGDRKIEELKIPLSIVATDLLTGKKVVLNTGPIAMAVAASASIPGFYEPRIIDHHQLVDGLVVSNVPTQVVRDMGADFVIAIDVIPRVIIKKPLRDVVHVVERALDIAVIQQASHLEELADIVIQPVDKNISPFALAQAAELIDMGERATQARVEEIKVRLRNGVLKKSN